MKEKFDICIKLFVTKSMKERLDKITDEKEITLSALVREAISDKLKEMEEE